MERYGTSSAALRISLPPLETAVPLSDANTDCDRHLHSVYTAHVLHSGRIVTFSKVFFMMHGCAEAHDDLSEEVLRKVMRNGRSAVQFTPPVGRRALPVVSVHGGLYPADASQADEGAPTHFQIRVRQRSQQLGLGMPPRYSGEGRQRVLANGGIGMVQKRLDSIGGLQASNLPQGRQEVTRWSGWRINWAVRGQAESPRRHWIRSGRERRSDVGATLHPRTEAAAR